MNWDPWTVWVVFAAVHGVAALWLLVAGGSVVRERREARARSAQRARGMRKQDAARAAAPRSAGELRLLEDIERWRTRVRTGESLPGAADAGRTARARGSGGRPIARDSGLEPSWHES